MGLTKALLGYRRAVVIAAQTIFLLFLCFSDTSWGIRRPKHAFLVRKLFVWKKFFYRNWHQFFVSLENWRFSGCNLMWTSRCCNYFCYNANSINGSSSLRKNLFLFPYKLWVQLILVIRILAITSAPASCKQMAEAIFEIDKEN